MESTKTTWNDFECLDFTFNERGAKIVYPSCPPNGKLILKAEYFDAFPNFEIEMLKKGYYLCFVYHSSRWAPDEEIDFTAEFVKHVSRMLDIEAKCVVVGMSCGGLTGTRLAQRHPHLVSALYLDAPVLNLLSMAGLGEAEFNPVFWREMVAAHGFSKSTVINFRKSPIDALDVLVENNIPVIMLYGDADNTVVYAENGRVLEDYYKENGGIIKVIRKSCCGHHPHCLENPQFIIDFIEQHQL